MTVYAPFLLGEQNSYSFYRQVNLLNKGEVSQNEFLDLRDTLTQYDPESRISHYIALSRLRKIKEETINKRLRETIDQNIAHIQQEKKFKPLPREIGSLVSPA